MKIQIFKDKQEIDLPKFIDSRALICANSGGTFNTYLSELRRNGLIEINSGEIKISQEFF